LIEKIFIGSLGILLTALLSSIIARHHKARERRVEAFDKFKDSFIPTFLIIDTGIIATRNFSDLVALFEIQKIAMLTFIDHLKGSIRRNFEEKWNKYQDWHREYNELENKAPHREEGKAILMELMITGKFKNMITEILEAAKK